MLSTETLMIFDWDDTLFPTSYITNNNINITNNNTKNELIIYFKDLDKILHDLLSKCLKHGSVVIVTNAMPNWVYISAGILPKTYNIINNNIKIISARSAYQKSWPDNIYKWKELAFRNHVIKNFIDKSKIHNILSIGDADYEYKALIKLIKIRNITHSHKKYLKSIKLLEKPSFDKLKDQLIVLTNVISKIIDNNSHLDLNFKNF